MYDFPSYTPSLKKARMAMDTIPPQYRSAYLSAWMRRLGTPIGKDQTHLHHPHPETPLRLVFPDGRVLHVRHLMKGVFFEPAFLCPPLWARKAPDLTAIVSQWTGSLARWDQLGPALSNHQRLHRRAQHQHATPTTFVLTQPCGRLRITTPLWTLDVDWYGGDTLSYCITGPTNTDHGRPLVGSYPQHALRDIGQALRRMRPTLDTLAQHFWPWWGMVEGLAARRHPPVWITPT